MQTAQTRRDKRNELGELLLRCRAERNISLRELGRLIKMDATGLSRIERGLKKPRRTTRLKLEEFLRKHGYFPKQEAA